LAVSQQHKMEIIFLTNIKKVEKG